jgi:hypothetical protein
MNKEEEKWTQIARTIIIGPELTGPLRTILKAMKVRRPFIDLKGELCSNASPPAPKVMKLRAVLLHEELDGKGNDTWNGVG